MSISTGTKHREYAKYYIETKAHEKHKNGPPSQRKYFKVADPQSEQRSELAPKDIQHRFILKILSKKIQLQTRRKTM
jgi:hypothetical protein